MPNWCFNRLTVTGPDEDLDAFYDKVMNGTGEEGRAHERPNLLSTFIPNDPNDPNWYEWNIANWGTKWEESFSGVERDEDKLTLRFDTAWSPPIKGLSTIAKMHPSLTFVMVYEEGGMQFMGGVRFGGGVTMEITMDYPEYTEDNADDHYDYVVVRLNDMAERLSR